MKSIIQLIYLIIIFLLGQVDLLSQDIFSLKECHKLAIESYAKTKNKEANKEIASLHDKSFSSMYLPQFNIEGSASYKSDVLTLPINIPNMNIPEINKESYQLAVNLQQLIYDGGSISSMNEIKVKETDINSVSIEIEQQYLKERVNNYYSAILLIQENQRILKSSLDFLKSKEKQLSSLVKNGAMLRSNVLSIRIEISKIEDQIYSLGKDKEALLKVLSEITGEAGILNSTLEIPDINFDRGSNVKRPETELFTLRKDLLESQKGQINSSLMPKLAAYAKAGYANPNPFNAFEDGFNPFYTFGVNFQWKFFDWNTSSRNSQILKINQGMIRNEEVEFNKNINNQLTQQKSDIDKYEYLILRDDERIKLQKEILDYSYSQLKNGTITSTEFILEMNNYTKAKQEKAVHKIQQSTAIVNYLTISGNL